MQVLVFLGLAAAGAYGVAEPTCTTKKCVFDDPTVTPSITRYPTTLTFTSAWSSSSSAYNFAVGAADDTAPAVLTTEIQNVQSLEPHASAPTAFPATVVVTAVTTHTVAVGAAPATTSRETVLSTWIVHQPKPTDLPRHERGLCGNCTQPASWVGDPTCLAAGNATACTRQCAQRDGDWYCFKQDDWYAENVMGRVCWWLNPFYGTTEYKLLGEPCRQGDRTMDCLACDTYG